MKIISRKDALLTGQTRYFTGIACKHGHIAPRSVANRRCIECSKASHRAYIKRYAAEHPERVASQALKSRQKCREKRRAYQSDYRKQSRGKIKVYHTKYMRDRRRRDPILRLKHGMYRMLRKCINLSGEAKTAKTEKSLGYSSDDLRAHLERQFTKGMSWDNYGEWHIDHITPISWFFENGITDPKQINCLSNLQPLWARDNLRKQRAIEKLI